jgi:hypothetical protein
LIGCIIASLFVHQHRSQLAAGSWPAGALGTSRPQSMRLIVL